MEVNNQIDDFLSRYDEQVFRNALLLRKILFKNLPDIIEQIDIPAKMIAYCYGQKYSELICTIIPSKKGLKLGFNRGTELSDPDKILQGKGKIRLSSDKRHENFKELNNIRTSLLNPEAG